MEKLWSLTLAILSENMVLYNDNDIDQHHEIS